MEQHITVFKEEAVDALRIRPDSIIVDATVGSGGHTQHIVSKLSKAGRFVGLDADKSAIDGLTRLETEAKTHLVVSNFRNIDTTLDSLGIERVDGILADLGWRMEQFSGNGKGFSFGVDEPLLMTYGESSNYPFTARDIVNDWDEVDIQNVIKAYGEERYYRKIAAAIVQGREESPIETSGQLAELIKNAVPKGYQNGRTHPATKTFQALRITVNDELDAVSEFIEKSVSKLAPGGRIAIITFHSIEDRIVKHIFKSFEKEGIAKVVTKKPIVPSREEQKINRRSRSAKLRILEKHVAV